METSVPTEARAGLATNVRVDVDRLSSQMELLVYACLVQMVLTIYVVVLPIVNISYNFGRIISMEHLKEK